MATHYDNSNSDNWGFASRAIHAGAVIDSQTGSRNLPIYLTSSYVFDSAEHAKQRFALEDSGPVYSRLTNPTTEQVENRLASLEGGVHAVLFASGAAAITTAVLNIATAGSHIVTSPRLYGGTESLFQHTLSKLGIETTFVEDPDDLQSWQDAVQDNTVLFFGETFANPQADILDIPAIAEVAHRNNVPLFVDNTIATPAVVRPLELGADVSISSTTKFLTGNGSALGGVLVDGGKFDWTVERNGKPIFPNLVEPDPAYHGLRYVDLGPAAFGLRARVSLLRDTGATLSAFNAWVLSLGLDTLQLRIQRHNENAQKVAEFLAQNSRVKKVNFAGLPSSPWYATKEKLDLPYTGSVLSFDLDGSQDDAWRFIDALKLHSNLANVGDVRSLVVHPASTTHSQSDAHGLERAGISESTIRLSVGIEDIDDILADLALGFEAIA